MSFWLKLQDKHLSYYILPISTRILLTVIITCNINIPLFSKNIYDISYNNLTDLDSIERYNFFDIDN